MTDELKPLPCLLSHDDRINPRFKYDEWKPLLEQLHNGDGETPAGWRIRCYECGLELQGLGYMKSADKRTLKKTHYEFNGEWYEKPENLVKRWNTRHGEGEG